MLRAVNKFRPRNHHRSTKPTTTTTTTISTTEATGTMTSSTGENREISELVMVYDADGSLSGELIYITKKLLGFGHCAACTISHGSRKEKPEFSELKQNGWGVPLRNIHRDEMDESLEDALRGQLPCIAARLISGQVILLLGHEQLEECSGDVSAFRAAVDNALEEQNVIMPPPSNTCELPSNAEHT